MKIPKRIKLNGLTCNIEYDKNLITKEDCLGRCHTDANKIRIVPIGCETPGGERIGVEGVQLAFYHEIVHYILEVNGYEELSADERFVIMLQNALMQLVPQIEKN